jgi:hypothetical protein
MEEESDENSKLIKLQVLQAVKFIYSNKKTELKSHENDLNNAFNNLKSHVNLNINKYCNKQIIKLNELDILKDTTPSEIDDVTEPFNEIEKESLFAFTLLQKDNYQKEIDEFTNCVEEITKVEQKFIDDSFDLHNKIVKAFNSCNTKVVNSINKDIEALESKNKNTNEKNQNNNVSLDNVLDSNTIVENNLVTYQKCLNDVVEYHKKFTNNYTSKVNSLISNAKNI